MKDEPRKLISLLGDAQKDPLAELVRNLRRNVPLFIEYTQLTAEVRRAKYTSLIAAGFTKEEALEMCKASPF